MNETLRTEAPEEALDEAVLQVQMNVGRIQRPLVSEHHGAHRLLFTPFPDRLLTWSRCPQGIERVHPRRIRVRAARKIRQDEFAVSRGRLQWLCSEQLQSTGNRLT